MALYFLAFLWGLLILLSLTGWGGVLNRLLFPEEQIDWGQRAAWGLAFSVVVGGLLNITAAISRRVILIYLGIGLAYWVIERLRVARLPVESFLSSVRSYRGRTALLLAVLVVTCLALIRYAGPVSTLWWWEDAVYFVFPEKMLQTGSLGSDPFSERRMASSLGGQSFLQTFVLSLFPEQYLRGLDSGLGLLIVLGLLIGQLRQVGVSPEMGVCTLLLALLIPTAATNTTSVLTGSALFLSLFRTLNWKGLSRNSLISMAFITAVVAGAIVALKSNFILPCAIFLGCASFFHVAHSSERRRAMTEAALTALLVVGFLLPWMLSMYRSSGTLFYPLLGKGYNAFGHAAYASLPGLDALSPRRVAKLLLTDVIDPSVVALGVLAICYLRSGRWRLESRRAALSLFIGAGLGRVLVAFVTQGWWVYRLTFPFVFAATLVLFTEVLSEASATRADREWRQVFALPAVALAAGLLVGANWSDSKQMYLESLSQVRSALRGARLSSDKDKAKYAEMQRSIPAGQTVLAKLEAPCLLDFRRNTVFIVDAPGPGLPPGLPLFEGSEALAAYLLGKSVRYIAYSYGGEAAFRSGLARVFSPGQPPGLRAGGEQALDFLGSLDELGRTRKRAYDDGHNFVLDLVQSGNVEVTP